MELTPEQKQQVTAWIKDGATLAEVQKRLQEELNVSMTYMDVRFLVLDLDVDVQDKEPETPKPPPDEAAGELPVEEAGGAPVEPDQVTPGGVSVDVDAITKPGSVVSGSVSFSDGKSGSWMLDQLGRLSLDVGDPAYRPSPEDVQTLQEELQKALSARGF
jgi:hypothetical protein